VDAADGDINRLVLVKGADVLLNRDFRRPLHNHPMLGAMKVSLQRKCGPRIHDDALYMIAATDIDRLIVPPRPIHPPMRNNFRAVFRPQLLDQ
jgi:hypothetical protein